MSTVEVSESEDVELENVLQQVFMECDASLSTSTIPSTVSIDDKVPIFRILEHIKKQLPSWSIDHFLELCKCLVVVSSNDCVNLQQFQEATKRWIAKLQQIHTQDSNNNVREKFCNSMNDTTVDSMKMDVDKDITGIELRMRVRKFDEENLILREELVRAEELVTNLERQRNSLENQLERYVEKCQQLEKENDEQKDKLNEVITNERTCACALQRFKKEHENLLKQLEAAQIEMQVIPPLKDKMEKISKEKADCVKQIARLQEELYEKEEEYERFKTIMTELEDTNSSMKETYEDTIRNLREKNRQLTDENMELQSLSALNAGVSGERFSISSISDTNEYCTPSNNKYIHSTPYKLEKVPLQNSLYAELIASGFTAECSRNGSWKEELEEELNQYDVAISTILEQLEKVIQSVATMSDCFIDDVTQFNPPDAEDTRTYNIEALKHKVAALLNMTTEGIARRRNVRDSSTQLRVDSDATVSSDQFGITSFRGLLTRIHECPKAETDLRSIALQCVDDNTDDPFLKVIRENVGHQDRSIIVPIVEELDRIIQNTIYPPVSSSWDRSAYGNSRYRSIYTLPSDSQSLQVSSLNAEDTRQASNCQNLKAISLDSSFVQGDGLTIENRGEKSAEVKTDNVCDREDLLHFEGNRSSEMPKISSVVLQTDSKALATLEETNSGSVQTSEMGSAAISTTPRRKLSVYYRSFDVVTVGDPCKNDREPTLEVRRSLSSPSMQEDKKIQAETMENYACCSDSTPRYPFGNSYRNLKSDSDSSNSCSPQKQLQDNLLDDELPVVQPALKKVYLTPTRLKFPQKIKSGLNESVETLDVTNARNRVFPDAISSESDISRSLLPPVVESDWHEKDDTTTVHSSSTFIIDKRETVDDVILGSNSVNETFPQKHLTARLIPHDQLDPTKIAESESPHSRTNVRVVGGDQLRVQQPVGSQMSSREDTSDSESEPARPGDRCIDEKIATDASESDVASLIVASASTMVPCENTVQNDRKIECDRDLFKTKQERRQRHLIVRRSLSEDESSGRMVCCCRQRDIQLAPLIQSEDQLKAFPSLTDARLQESGIAKLPDTEIDRRENLSELDLQKKYTAFSLCLCTDRVTLPRRMEVSLRQRDQSEKNLSCEVQKMQQDIQELAPLCTDRESVERVERVRHQLDMIARCAHRVSCTAETLGAVHQENKVSRAVLLADRYLQLLQSRCEKLAVNIAETKRILVENNIVIEENSGELGDDLPRIRYRSGTPVNNRMMMARRRASVATMSRPMGGAQDVKKETVRQRNSVSGRVTVRRPSLSYESSKLEIDKLDRTDSSSSISELRGIFEHTESQRDSKEENNNMLRLNQSNNQNIINCAIVDNEIWTTTKQETSLEFLSANEDASRDCKPCGRSTQPFRLNKTTMTWRTMLWGILIFFLGFYVNHAISMVNTCCSPLSRWSIEEILKRYVQIKNAAPHPM